MDLRKCKTPTAEVERLLAAVKNQERLLEKEIKAVQASMKQYRLHVYEITGKNDPAEERLRDFDLAQVHTLLNRFAFSVTIETEYLQNLVVEHEKSR